MVTYLLNSDKVIKTCFISSFKQKQNDPNVIAKRETVNSYFMNPIFFLQSISFKSTVVLLITLQKITRSPVNPENICLCSIRYL